MTERIAQLNGVDLCIDEYGAASDPALVLVNGAASAMDWFDVGLCELLAAGGRRVLRYDHRDTGRSTTCPPGEPDYSGADLVGDLAALIEDLGSGPAHVAGLSMGGALAQQLAMQRPKLFRTLTLMSTTPAVEGVDDLPPMSPDLAAWFGQESPDPDWSDRAAVQQYFIDGQHQFAGDIPVDEHRIREIAGHTFDRSSSIASANNHWSIGGTGATFTVDQLRGISMPTLVVHGSTDPFFPLGHGEALAREIPDARLLTVPGMGHEVPPPETWDLVVPELLAHTDR